jgi:hypothetical protein
MEGAGHRVSLAEAAVVDSVTAQAEDELFFRRGR